MALKLKTEKTMVKDNTDRVKNAESSIVQQAIEIALRVKADTFNALEGRVTNAEASLIVQASAIALKVSQSNFNALAERVGSAESSLSLQADAIALKVSSDDFTGATIASLINLSPSEIKIKSNKITLEGLITANGNFKVLADGSIEAVNAKLSGAITATRMNAPSNAAYYGEIGASGGFIGLGLFDTNFGPEAFFEVLETGSGKGFIFRDKNNIERFSASEFTTAIKDSFGETRFYAGPAGTILYSQTKIVQLFLSDNGAILSKNGVTLAQWGF